MTAFILETGYSPNQEELYERMRERVKENREENGEEMINCDFIEKISALRICVIEVKEKPSILEKRLCPKNIEQYAWIPQTVGDQIWVFYNFLSIKERKEWEEKVKLPHGFEIDRSLIFEAEKWKWQVYEP